MGSQLGMAVIVIAFDGGLLDCPVHPFDLAIGPGMLDFGKPVLDPVLIAAQIEHVRHTGRSRALGVSRREGELDAIVGQHGVDFVGHGFDQGDQEG